MTEKCQGPRIGPARRALFLQLARLVQPAFDNIHGAQDRYGVPGIFPSSQHTALVTKEKNMDFTSLSSLQALQTSTQAGAIGAPVPDQASITRFQQLLGEPQSPTLAAEGPGGRLAADPQPQRKHVVDVEHRASVDGKPEIGRASCRERV